jgi:hypothetical protein
MGSEPGELKHLMYPEEKKSIEISSVVASERESASYKFNDRL